MTELSFRARVWEQDCLHGEMELRFLGRKAALSLELLFLFSVSFLQEISAKEGKGTGEKGKIPRVQNLGEPHNFLECCKREVLDSKTENAKQKENILRKDMLP